MSDKNSETARGGFNLPINCASATAQAHDGAKGAATAQAVPRDQLDGGFVAKAKAYGKEHHSKSDTESFSAFARTQEGAALYAEYRKRFTGRK